MANSDWGRIYYPDDNSSANMGVQMGLMADSLEGRTVQRFTTVAARDSAFASLTSAQKLGTICYIDGKGYSGWNGSEWKRFPMYDLDFKIGHANVVTNNVGLFGIAHNLNVTSVVAQLTPIYGGPSGAAEDVMNRTKLAVREFQYNLVVCHAQDVTAPNGGAMLNTSLVVSYSFWKMDG